jgi:hypothetical protein
VIACGDKVAFGAPRFPFSGAAVAVGVREGVGVGDGGGVSLGSGVGEDFFFAFDDGDALGDGETDFFLGDELGEGDADSFFAVEDFFRLCGVGVGVGVEKIFLIFSPTDSSAANGGEIVADRIRTDARSVESLRKVGRLCRASFEATLKRRFPSALLY